MFLIDTDVLSALRRRDRHPEMVRWLQAQRTADLYLSAVTIGEIEHGIAQQQRRDPSFARELSIWLDRVLAWYGDRVLDVDVPTARRWGRLSGDLGRGGPDHCRHGAGARPDRGDPQRQALRADGRSGVQPL